MNRRFFCGAFAVAGFFLLWSGCETVSDGGKHPPVMSDKLRIGDFITVSFSGIQNPPPDHPENIKENGTITLPYIGSVVAADKTPKELEQEIHDKYVDKYFRILTVTVISSSRYFYVSGQVKSEGRYQYTGETTVTKAIAVAGGFTDFANRRKVQLTRINGQKLKVNCNDVLDHPERDPLVFPGDSISVPRRYF